jgi:hypothetical protein
VDRVDVEDRLPPIVVNGTRAMEDPAKNDASRRALEKEKVAMVYSKEGASWDRIRMIWKSSEVGFLLCGRI